MLEFSIAIVTKIFYSDCLLQYVSEKLSALSLSNNSVYIFVRYWSVFKILTRGSAILSILSKYMGNNKVESFLRHSTC